MLRLHLLLVVSVVLLRDEQHAVGAVVRTGGICSLLCGREQDRERGSVNFKTPGERIFLGLSTLSSFPREMIPNNFHSSGDKMYGCGVEIDGAGLCHHPIAF
ncbi:unnamed protein product [Amoebophrya sp. A25]|nr:unnamed protein product [Amoebophrya sp. A25]|eukprot:GSA25T00013894001.1